MNTKIIKKIIRDNKNTLPIFRELAVQNGVGFMLNLSIGYFFTPTDDFKEDGVYNPEYIDDGIITKSENTLVDYPELNFDPMTATPDFTITATKNQLKQLSKCTSKDSNTPALQTLMLHKVNGAYKLVATDGYILAWEDVEVNGLDDDRIINLPIEFIKYVMMFKSSTLTFQFNNTHVWVKEENGETLVSSINDLARPDVPTLMDKFLKNFTTKQYVSLKSILKGVWLDVKNRGFRTETNPTIFHLPASISEPENCTLDFTPASGILIMPLNTEPTPCLDTNLLHKVDAKTVTIYAPENPKSAFYIEVID